MAQTTIITAQETAANSTDVVVGTTPVKLALYTTEDPAVFPRVKCTIQEKVPGDTYQAYTGGDLVERKRREVFLTNTQKEFLLTAPGTYRVVKPVTTSDVGVFSEDGVTEP